MSPPPPARFDGLSGSLPDGTPNTQVPKEVLASIRRNGVCLKGTLFTQLDKKNTNTQARDGTISNTSKDLGLGVNAVYTTPSIHLIVNA